VGVIRIVVVLLLIARPAYAGYPLFVESIEWGVADADVVVRGAITRTVALDDQTTRYDVLVHETIKGGPRKALSIVQRSDGIVLAPVVDMLFFLVETDATFVLREASESWDPSVELRAIDLRAPPKLMKSDYTILKTRREILNAVRRAPKQDIITHYTTPVINKRDKRAKAMGSATGLVLRMPADAKLEALAHELLASRIPKTRFEGFVALAPFPSEQNIALVLRLMRDDDPDIVALARHLLLDWGVPIPTRGGIMEGWCRVRHGQVLHGGCTRGV
jgi:hypothetical protein